MPEQDYIQFEAYLLRELSPKEQALFQDRLKNDAQLNNAFNTYKEASKFLEHSIANEKENDAFKANLKTVSSAYFNTATVKTSKTKRINPWYYSIAAAVVLIFGVFIGRQFSNPTYSDYANYGTISLTVRGVGNDLLKNAEVAFNNKNFKKAEVYFSELLKTDKNNIELKLYKAVTLVELDNFKTADKILRGITQTPSGYKNKAAWYLALSKLKQEDKMACVEVLKTIPKGADDYKQAQKLLKKLE